MFRVGDERSTNAEHKLWVNLTVGVFGRVEQRNIEFCRGDFAVGHRDVGLEVGDVRAGFAEVHPLDVLVLHDAACKASAVTFGDGFGKHKRSGCDVEVFFFFGVHPFHNALNDERAEVDFTAGQLGKVVLG